MTDEATLRTRLAEAEGALHSLMVGSSAVSISHKGKSVTYRKTDEAKLRAYIFELKTLLGEGQRPAPLRFSYR
ncbi:MAG: gpW family head-tail joining protein [Pseudomonadota bacterium]